MGPSGAGKSTIARLLFGFFDVFSTCIWSAVGDVVVDVVVKQDRVLRDDTDGRAQAVLSYLTDVFIVNCDPAFIHIIKAKQ